MSYSVMFIVVMLIITALPYLFPVVIVGMILYYIYAFISRYRMRKAFDSQSQRSNTYTQQNRQYTNQNRQYSNQNTQTQSNVKRGDVIDVEYTVTEIEDE